MGINWDSSVLWGIIGLITTIFFGYIFYIKSSQEKSLNISTKSDLLVPDFLTTHNELEILYNKKKVKTLVNSTITIKNTGNTTIEASDIAPNSPIIFSTSKEFLLNSIEDYTIIKSNKNSLFSLKKISNAEFKLIFDYFKPGDIIVFTLLHDGFLEITGELKNGDIYIDNVEINRHKRIEKIKTIILLSILFGLMFCIISIFILFITKY